MGINRRDAELLLWLHRQNHISAPASVIELGAQQLSYDLLSAPSVIDNLGRAFGATGPKPVFPALQPPLSDGIEEILDPNAPPAQLLWQWLGFQYAAIDIDGGVNSIPLDLNFDEVPAAERNKYSLVTNYGTTEHVANQLNAFKVAHDLAAVGGLMIHHLPSQGNFNHGLLNYSPKFFWMLARSNEYNWVYFDYFCSDVSYPLPRNLVDAISPFQPDVADRLASYRTSNTAIVVVLKKQADTSYVPALDVPNNSRTDNKELLSRYPTVLKPVA